MVGATVGARVGSPGNGLGRNVEGVDDDINEGAREKVGEKVDGNEVIVNDGCNDGSALGPDEDVNEGASVGAPGNGEGW